MFVYVNCKRNKNVFICNLKIEDGNNDEKILYILNVPKVLKKAPLYLLIIQFVLKYMKTFVSQIIMFQNNKKFRKKSLKLYRK